MAKQPGSEVYVEFRAAGRFVKVSAICAVTGFEVSMVGDPSVGQDVLRSIAVRKLRRVMEKAAREGIEKGKKTGLV